MIEPLWKTLWGFLEKLKTGLPYAIVCTLNVPQRPMC
jgi:hypothetical protein